MRSMGIVVGARVGGREIRREWASYDGLASREGWSFYVVILNMFALMVCCLGVCKFVTASTA